MFPLPFSELHKTLPRIDMRYPVELVTLGDHIRKRRLDLNLIQKDVADRIGVTKNQLNAWERNHITPLPTYMPRIISFLGYVPNPIEDNSMSGKIKSFRYVRGMSQKEMGALLGVDASTIASWEENEFEPHSKNRMRLKELLKE